MIIEFFIFSSSTGAPVAGLVPTFTYYKRTNSDGTITDLADPSILDKGAGLYQFTIVDADLLAGSFINYVVDCTASAASRYLQDNIRSTDALAIESSITPATINVFGVTNDSVKRHYFPQWPSFSTKSNPTAVTVDEAIDEEGATLGGELGKRSVIAADINSNDTPMGNAWCAATLKLMVAIRIAPAVTGLDPAMVQRWSRELKSRLKDLEDNGATVLGDVTASETTESPLEATTHISTYNLETSDAASMSSTAIRLRYDDEL